jgi:hypothetical protein
MTRFDPPQWQSVLRRWCKKPSNSRLEQRIDHRAQRVGFARQLKDVLPELGPDCSAEEQTILLEHAADLVLQIASDADQV